jgi:hypothetical protein
MAASMKIEELKDRITIEEVLAHFGADTGRRWTSWGAWTPINCPFCSDRNGSGSVNLSAGRFLCHQCGCPRDGRSGDIVDIAKYELQSDDTNEACRWLAATFLS